MGPGRPAHPSDGARPVALPAFDLQRFADGERTEPPTPRRRHEARRRGQVAKSADLSLAVVVLAGALVLRAAGGLLVRDAASVARGFWGGWLWDRDLTFESLREAAVSGLWAMRGVALVAAGVGALALASQLAQVGFLASGYPLWPQLARLNPVLGLQRLFSLRSAVELAKGLAKAVVVAWAAWSFASQAVQAAPRLVEMHPAEAAVWVGGLAYQELLRMGLVLLVIGIADYAYQRREFETSLRMSRHEVMDEYRQTEGDPHVRARIRSRMRQLATQRMMQRVPRASVVVTNPTHVAVALEYEAQAMDAPVVVAKGVDHMARRIVEVASRHDVPVVENPPLAWSLYDAVEVGQAIPPELYRAVAEVLAFVYRLRHARRYGAAAAGTAAGWAPGQAAGP